MTRADWWTYPAPRLTVAGTDTQTYTVNVPSTTRYLKVAVSHPGLGAACCNGMFYDVTVKDAAGAVVATGTEAGSTGTTSAFVDLRAVSPKVKYGAFTVEVSGFLAASDPDTLDSDSLLGRMITVQVAQVIAGR